MKDFLIGLAILCGLYLSILYLKYYRPLKKTEDYFLRSVRYASRKRYDKGIETLILMLRTCTLTIENYCDAYFCIGDYYYQQDNYEKSNYYFEKGFSIIDSNHMQIPYSKVLEDALLSYVKVGKEERALSLYDDLSECQKYDQNFKKLEKILKYIRT